MSKLSVKSVRVTNGQAIISFTDGTVATFIENYEWFRAQNNQIEQFTLSRGGRILATFNSRYQYPVNRTPIGFAQLSSNITIAEVAKYWRAAQDFLIAESRQGRKRAAWTLVSKGDQDLEDIEKGKWPAPKRR